MKQRKPRKPRNPMARALRECKLFAPKASPIKKGKGMKYDRNKTRNDPSGSYLLAA